MANAQALLEEYRQKRDFAKTAEPSGAVTRRKASAAKPDARIFVVQKHAASRLHYDFRLELDGVLKSWAVAKGPSLNPKDKRLAVHVEDHPLDYATFEGTIPEGQYGGGTVMLWDFGTWEPIGDPHKGMADGDLKIRLHGERLKGEWVLVHMKGRDTGRRDGGKRENWLLIKHRDDYAREDDGIVEKYTTSIETGRDMEGITKGLKTRKSSARPKVWTGGKSVSLPAWRPPQLATLVDTVPDAPGWVFEMKYDGYRALVSVAGEEVRIYTRGGKDWTTQFARLREPFSTLTRGSALIDGEICAFDEQGRTDFSTLKTSISNGGPLVYFAFDLIEQDGEDLSSLLLVERKERLKALLADLPSGSTIQYSDHVRANGQRVLDAICREGHEGIIAKRADAPYRTERTKSWLKIKCARRQEFVIGGWRPSEKRNRFASLLLGTWEDGKLVYHGRVGTGFTEADSLALQQALDARSVPKSLFAEVPRDISRKAKWIRPELVAEVAFTELTPDGILRHPSFLGLREDKPAQEIRLETTAPVPAEPKSQASRQAAKKRTTAAVEINMEAGIAAAEKAGVRLTSPERVVYPGQGVTKGELFAYYSAVAEPMLKHLAGRPLSLVRCPQGRSKYCFFQKHDTGGFPEAIRHVPITQKNGETEDFIYVDSLAGILSAVQMNTLEFHIWGSRTDDVETPDRIIFDIDPDEGLDFGHVRQAAADIRDQLKEIGLKTYPMVTGGKGVHVIAPLQRGPQWPEVKDFCHRFAQRLASREPDRFVANMSKAKRKGRMFIDYLRNERGSTAVCPFSTRSREGAPIAVPITWEELPSLEGANVFSLGGAAARASGPDPWPDYSRQRQMITEKMLAAVRD